MRVMLLYRSLTRGGTERQIVALARGLVARGHAVTVLTFYDENLLGDELTQASVTLVSLKKTGRWDILGFLGRFLSEVRRRRPQILYSFLPTANLVALSARLADPRLSIVWGVRTAFLVLNRYDRLTRLSYWIERKSAGMASLIIANSHAGAKDLARLGYPERRVRVVSNGVDTDRFRPDAGAGARVRVAWKIAVGTVLVGTVARLDPEKGIPLFLEAAALLAATDDRLRFAAVGGGEERYRAELTEIADRLGIGSRIAWAGARDDMPDIYNAFDLMVLSSPNEGTSNVVLEAMACGVPVVATDVGDNARSIGSWGHTVPFGDPATLAEAIRTQLERRTAEGGTLAEGCRQHILDNYSLSAMVGGTETLLQSLVAGRR